MAFRTTFYARHCCSFSTSLSGWRQGHRPRSNFEGPGIASSLAVARHRLERMPGAAPCGPVSKLIGDHAGHFLLVRLVHHAVGIEMALALGRLRSQDVALKRVSALELARTCLFEALGRSTVCLKLWHSSPSSLQQNGWHRTATAARAGSALLRSRKFRTAQ